MLNANYINDPRLDDAFKVTRWNGVYGDMTLGTLIQQLQNSVGDFTVPGNLFVGKVATINGGIVTTTIQATSAVLLNLTVTGTMALSTVTMTSGQVNGPLVVTGITNLNGGGTTITQPPSDNSNNIATTAFVHAALASYTGGVTSFNTRTGAVTLTLSDVTSVGGAPLASPALTGTPTAPTPAPGDNSTRLATTAFLATNYLTSSMAAATYLTIPNAQATYAPLFSPTFSGLPAAPTAPPGTNNTQLATTAYVQAALSGSVAGVASFNGRTGAVTLTTGDITGAGGVTTSQLGNYLPVAGGTITGNLTINGSTSLGVLTVTGQATGVTPTAGDNSTNFATTAFIASAGFLTNATAASIYAPIASPVLTGTPSGPTAVPGTNNNQLATTAFVAASFLSQASASATYLTIANAQATYAPLTSPAFTGTPTGPTPAPGDSSTKLATTAFISGGFASLVSPALTGVPTAPTAVATDGSTQIATDQFVWNHGMQSSGQLGPIAAPFTLSVTTHAGHNVLVTGPGAITFPVASCTFMLSCMGSSPVTFSGMTGTDFSGTLYPGQTVILCGDGTGYWRVAATGLKGNSFNAANMSWTPNLQFVNGTAGIAYSSRSGYYAVVGNFCILTVTFALSNRGTSTGGAYISGLPITPADNSGCAMLAMTNMVSLPGAVIGYAYTNTTISLNCMNASGLIGLDYTNFSNTSAMNGTIVYRI